MKMPVITRPVFTITLPSTGQPLAFTPFIVADSKLLAMARHSESFEDALNAIKQVISNNLIDRDIDVDLMPQTDIEKLYINLQARSVSEKVEMYYTCQNVLEKDKKCGMVMNLEVDLLDLDDEEKFPERTVMFTETDGIVLKYPDFGTLKKLTATGSEFEDDIKLFASCLESVISKDEIYQASEATEEELVEYIEQLPTQYLDKIETFFENIPSVKKTLKVDCPRCAFKHVIVLEGLEDFFQ